ncbi:MAG: M12 family metallo-peptidase [Phycisphaerales bacterium]|jgi:hypothetical protein|nr:M12 family metallo-peptidase [Phycisphaerales bacterium]MDP7086139.1 M12 family metallo-peptidase [Phycisphaerales bacterium]MDP7189528.1 M12 family metallo-peptidase [Phycisphaerales bacterium]MDP7519940.1 M12 family metallo-peptidase [Phycisphaerales bacterium]
MPKTRIITLLTLAASLGFVTLAAQASQKSIAGESLPGLGSWQGVRELRLGKGRTIRPDMPLQLEMSSNGRAKVSIADDPSGTVSLQQWKGHVRGVVRSPKHGTFLIQRTPSGHTTVTELDPSTLVGCDADQAVPPAADADGDAPSSPPPPAADGDAPDGDDGGVVDIFVVYTDLARANAGSTDAMETAIHGWINESNEVYRDSESAVRIRLVGTDEVSYAESGSFSNHLSRLAGTSDGYMDDVHTWRDDTGADVVALIVTDSSSCGLGYTIKNDVTGSPSSAFFVVRDYCADIQFSFTHELGHNMGCCHDLDHPGSCAGGASLYPHSFGHRFTGDSDDWRTVMAYTDDVGDPMPQTYYQRIGHLSNPDVDYDNEPTGTATADNAATHDSMRSVTAAYRTAITAITCPGDLGEDAIVSVDDLLGLLERWGAVNAADTQSLAADLNGDAEIDASDLLVLITEFGPCPS